LSTTNPTCCPYANPGRRGGKPASNRWATARPNTWGYSPYVISSLTGGWVCRLQLLLVLASAVNYRSASRGTHDHILMFQIWDSPNLEAQVFPQEQSGPVIPPYTVFPFRRLLRFTGLRWRYLTPPLHGSTVGRNIILSFDFDIQNMG
jgi:hypothetical protein